MESPTSPRKLYPLYIFPSSPKIHSKISTNIKTLIHPLDIPNISKIHLTLLPKVKALLLRISKEANTRLRIPPSTTRMLLSFLKSIDIKAFVNGFIIPCLKKLVKIVRGRSRQRQRRYSVVRRLQLSFSRTFKYRVKKSTSSSYFRFHYNWSSRSYMLHVPATMLMGRHSSSYRFLNINKGNCNLDMSSNLNEEGNGDSPDLQLNGYLEWLEQREHDGDHPSSRDSSSRIVSNINTLAEKFIEEKHETFILEKQESERRFQDMMARSL